MVQGKNAKKNAQFTRVVLFYFFLFTTWCVALHIILSNDIQPNPGPENHSASTNSDSQNSSFFSHNLSILQLNIQSLLPNLYILETEMQPYDIVVKTETWLSPKTTDDDLLISNFSRPYRRDRIDRPGGGVAIYIRHGLHSVLRSDLINGNIEAISVEIRLKNHKLLLCGVYRPPNSGNPYWELIEITFDNLSNSGIGDIVIVGDFNNDMTTPSSSAKIRNLISSYNFSQLIDEPTHYTENSSSIIDLILVSKPENAIFSNVTSPFIPNLIRYHCPTVVYLRYRKPVTKTYKRHIWLYDRGDYATFRQQLSQVNWDEIFTSNNVDHCAELITESIINAAKHSIPNKTVTVRPSEPQWINSHIKREIRKRKRLFRKAKRKNTSTVWTKFKEKRNEVLNINDKGRKETIHRQTQ